MMKTAIETLIEKYELQLREVRKKIRKVDAIYRDVWKARESQLCSAIHLARNELDTERQQIEDKYQQGYDKGFSMGYDEGFEDAAP